MLGLRGLDGLILRKGTLHVNLPAPSVMFEAPYQDERAAAAAVGFVACNARRKQPPESKLKSRRIYCPTSTRGVPDFVPRWPQTKGRNALAALLAAIALLAIPATARSQQVRPVAGPVANDPQLSALNSDALSAQDASSGTAKNPAGNAGQEAPTPQSGTQQSGPQQSAVPAPSTAENQKSRLAVNPVTGLTTVPASNFTPLTGKERLKLYWTQDFFSVGAYFKPTLFALVLDQATNSPRQWGGGFSGFGLREASRIAGNLVSGTIRAPLSAVLHEDVRYISNERGGKRRLLHAIEYSFLTYNNQGHPTLNISKLVGYYASTAISTTWHPGRHSVVEYTFANASEQLGLSVPFNVLQEFWPNIVHKRAHKQAGP